MESLQTLILSGCSNLLRFPEIDGKMECLKTLDLSGCYKVGNLPGNLQQSEFLEVLHLRETAITEPPIFIFRFKHLKVLSLSGCKGRSFKLRPNLPPLFEVFQRGRTNSIPLMGYPSGISCLSSLTALDLSGNNFVSIPASLTRLSKNHFLGLSNCSLCNLSEGDILGLSSLKSLDLRGNNFISIPASLIRLSRLSNIRLSNCKELKSLPELLTSINAVWIDGCKSLELVAYPSKVCKSISRGNAVFRGIHCYRLAEEINALSLLKKHIKVFANARKIFSVLFLEVKSQNGSAIRVESSIKWFSHQRVESSIRIPLPFNIRNDSQWMGVAFCCIFTNDDASRDEGLLCRAAPS
ncbi:disease resistance-like protein DSC1 [Hibiscus syriacus]|uniref:disease resistance-like protein DSC1 n=1 Tax=Hibiscus syriacus TaxID=106335 RepID=UPI0019205FAB|nr:disease resistance-like protein DSC1 [Hibiscus syriacus]